MDDNVWNDSTVEKDNFWTRICAGEQLLDIQGALNSSTPYLNDCSKDTVLTWPAAVFLLFGTIFQIYVFNFTPKRGQLKWTILLILKLAVSFAIFAITSADLSIHIIRISNNENTSFASDLASVLSLLCALDLLILTEANRRKGRRSSGVIYIGWFILAVCGVLPFIQICEQVHSGKSTPSNGLVYYQHTLYICYYPLILVELILHAFADVYKYGTISDEKECPESGSSFIVRITCAWFVRMAILGYKRSLTMDDLWKLREKDTSARIIPRWEKFWNRALAKQRTKSAPVEPQVNSNWMKMTIVDDKAQNGSTPRARVDYQGVKNKQCPSLVANIGKMVIWQLIPAVVCKFCGDMLQFAGPQILKLILAFISRPSMPLWIGIFYVLLMFLTSVVQALLQQQSMYRMFTLAMNVRTALTEAVYKKALRLSTTARKDATVGELVNLMAVDVQRLSDVAQFVQQLWATPIMLAVGLYSLHGELGYSALAGFGVMLILLPCNYKLSRYQRCKQIRMLGHKDKRMRLMNEILNGMKVLKLYAWEDPFEKKVNDIREEELRELKRGSYIDGVNSFTVFCAPFLIASASFTAFVLSSPNNILTPEKAFVSLTLFNILRQPLNMLPNVISACVQASVSNKRLKKFFSEPELNPDLVIRDGNQEESILIENGTFSWSDTDDKATLNNINFSVKPGQLVALVGPVGCGKSSLLSATLGDMEPRGGLVYVKGSVAYVPQQAWIQSLPLRNNIVFTRNYVEDMYNRVVDACALKPDFDILPSGDSTEVGEKGINLSGGQKQRVSLARAVYQDRDVYLMDDPLSAVDAHVGRHIFTKVIGNEGLLRGKTRVLVTHGLAYLKHMDNIFVMKDGKITQSGTLAELVRQGGAFAEFLEMYMARRSHDPTADPDDELIMNEIVEELQKSDPTVYQRLRSYSTVSDSSRKNSITSNDDQSSRVKNETSATDENTANEHKKMMNGNEKKSNGNPDTSRKGQKLGRNIKQEKVRKGKIQWRTYTAYFAAIGYLCFAAVLIAYFMNSSLGVGTNIWLSEWSEDSNRPNAMPVGTRLGVYVALGIAQGLCVFVAALTSVRVMVAASAKLHQRLLSTLMRAPMSFYDVTPLGAIISRVGKDVDIMDSSLPQTFRSWIMQSLNVLSSVVVILISTPIVGLAMLPLGVLYYLLQRFYVSTARQLRRIESASRAPIYSHFGESLSGATSIRAYAVERHFVDEADFRIDRNIRVVYTSVVSNRWLNVFLQVFGHMLVMFTGLFAVLARDSGIAAGLVGLSISYAMMITNTLHMSVRQSSDFEANVVAVERIKEYAEIKTEADWVTDTRPPQGWPTHGVVDFDGFQLRYREGQELVLKGLQWHVESKEKAGVVGRTGAGKSSMTLALFRIVEAAGGRIVIDNLDISKIGLHDLRSRLSIIPQDPILFSGTLRVNLDPFDEHNDSELWAALEQAHLKQFVAQLADGLQHKVTEGGDNLSVGQRQLVCLARALLRHSKILVLDEATAAVDLETERLILETIRNRFKDCTIITIAHRLNTIMDSDRILVMSQGRALEHGSPEVLLSDENSAFFAMAKDAGLINHEKQQL